MTVTEKVEKQAQNIVVNLADSPLTFKQIENALSVKPVDGLILKSLMRSVSFWGKWRPQVFHCSTMFF